MATQPWRCSGPRCRPGSWPGRRTTPRRPPTTCKRDKTHFIDDFRVRFLPLPSIIAKFAGKFDLFLFPTLEMLWKAVAASLSHRGRSAFEVFSRLPFFQIKESNFRPSFSPFDEGELQNWDGRADTRELEDFFLSSHLLLKGTYLCLLQAPAEVFFLHQALWLRQ